MINGILAAEELLASRVAYTFRTYPKQITAAIAAMLLSAGTLAVASLGPDASDLPIQQVLEATAPVSFADQSASLENFSFTLFRTDVSRSSDTAEALMKRLGISDPAATAFVRGNAEARMALFARVGRTVTAEATQENQLQKLSARWIPDADGGFKRFVVERTPTGFVARTERDMLTPGTRLASGTIRSSLFAATDDSRIPDAVASQLADIFAGDVDVRSLRKGDRFAVVYETFEADGQALRSGRVLSAEFENNGKVHQAVWFQPPGAGQKGSYYRPNGDSLRKAYLASPVEFSRVSSGFAMRMHPILNSWRQHNGIDYAAPTGTAVRTVGDGTVDFAGTQSGYGNIVIINHRNNQQTAYAHLSRINVKAGESVSQGQTIGAVGSTGWATGPHLHFEYRVGGAYQDPTTIAQEGGAPITAALRPAFERIAVGARTELAAAFSVIQASAD
ncbi:MULTISPECIES: M23 family metallopeptidase [Variovorax]|uniref:Peptidase M23 n=1 Tax=Variovorax boronicumulans TaxID=436515 RepID=A0A250DR39_9BURK|nr:MULTISPECIES: M23 family metallopeptidase [Variovorax]ATA56817.1 peptidase M23 [Variovorax boronicumulans]PBI92071.1 Murein DD-endopeptidase MepM [Variovorax boronicumulans]TSD56745.1 M23 family metallopeptidase [Variovorax sp. KBS0712]GER17594.1 M23 family peptidase [Variovorax boronicumulans]